MSLWGRLLNVLYVVLGQSPDEPLMVTINRTTKRTGYVRPDIADFFSKIRMPALAIESATGIPWTFAATQAGHESRWGLSRLTTQANNLFGFTASQAWRAAGSPTVRYQTRECSDKPPEKIRYWEFEGDIFSKTKTEAGGSELMVWRFFRKYGSWEESLHDWANLLAKERFARALAGAKAGNFQEFATGLQEAGYATDKDQKTGELVYAKKLIALHESLEGIG